MDTLSPERRSENMRRIRSKDTTPEIVVRRQLHRRGYRFRLHRKDLPGVPDIVLPRYKLAIFVNGCFWHGHECQGGRRPKSNVEYWETKIRRNRERDMMHAKHLRRLGWKRGVLWACELSDENRVWQRLRRYLK